TMWPVAISPRTTKSTANLKSVRAWVKNHPRMASRSSRAASVARALTPTCSSGTARVPEAPRPHVGPHVCDVLQALGLRAGLADEAPPVRQLAIRKPERILILVIDDHGVHAAVFVVRIP